MEPESPSIEAGTKRWLWKQALLPASLARGMGNSSRVMPFGPGWILMVKPMWC